MGKLSKGKIYPLISLYKCRITVFSGVFLPKAPPQPVMPPQMEAPPMQ